MSKKLRPTPAGVIACLALAVSLGGTAFAAAVLVPKNSVGSPQVINGSLQKADLSARAVAALRGNRGPRGFQGIQGAPGATGPAGPIGPKGEKGPPGDPWAGGGLASGKTLRGVFGPGGTAADADDFVQEAISFGFVLGAGNPVVHFIDVGAQPPAECPGTPGSPQALPGHLCVFASQAWNVKTECVFNPVNDDNTCDKAATKGFGVEITADLPGDFWLQGSWAVTAA